MGVSRSPIVWLLTVDHHGDVHEVDLAAGLHAGLAAVHALVGLGHLMDLEVVVWQHLEPAFTAPAKRRRTDGWRERVGRGGGGGGGKDKRTTVYDRERGEIRKLGKPAEKIAALRWTVSLHLIKSTQINTHAITVCTPLPLWPLGDWL